MNNLHGYAGKILYVDLSREKRISVALKKGFALQNIGGKGFGVRIISKETEPKIEPYNPSSMLVLATGPVNGLFLSGASRLTAIFKSPLTGAFGESQCGGTIGTQIKRAGYDVIVIRGESKEPSYLLIKDESVELRRADYLWGKDAFETERIIKEEDGPRLAVLSIGQAGENLVRFACITHDKGRQFGRCGSGAVMGSKKLKAIAVEGSKTMPIAQVEAFEHFRKELNEKIKERLSNLQKYGTPSMMDNTNLTGTLPTRYWTDGEFDGFEKINALAVKEKLAAGNKACYGCTVACRILSKVEKGVYAGTEVEGPEYETLYAFGSLCGNSNLESIAKANELCDRLGMDVISAGNALAFLMECCNRGILTKNEISEPLRGFGDHQIMITILEKIAYRRDIGNVLAEGVKRAATILGRNTDEFAIHVKGLEPPGYDPRGLKGVALSYAVSCRGACHLRHMAYRPNLTGKQPFTDGKVNRLSYCGQAQIVRELEWFHNMVDSMVLCKFLCLPTIGPISWAELTNLYNIVTGMKVKKNTLIKKAKRISSLVKSYNLREGVDRKADMLPSRFLREKLGKGASKGETVDYKGLKTMLTEYYR